MFHPPEVEDAFPGQYSNFYRVKLLVAIPGLSYQINQEVELEGLDSEFFYDRKNDCKIAKNNCKILKKLIRNKLK